MSVHHKQKENKQQCCLERWQTTAYLFFLFFYFPFFLFACVCVLEGINFDANGYISLFPPGAKLPQMFIELIGVETCRVAFPLLLLCRKVSSELTTEMAADSHFAAELLPVL